MNIKLSQRLQWIADWVPEGGKLADIGSDHALLPSYLADSGRITFSVAGEANQGPYEAARRQIMGSKLEHIVDVRLGDGLAVLKPNEVDCISIAGMGGSLIVNILSAQPEKLEGVRRLILQPNVGEDIVRRWLRREGWALVQEHILQEDGKIYEVLLAERLSGLVKEYNVRLYAPRLLSCGMTLSEEWLLELGPILSQAPSEVFFEKWKREIAKRDRVLHTMELAERDEVKQRREQLAQNKAKLGGIIECLRMEER